MSRTNAVIEALLNKLSDITNIFKDWLKVNSNNLPDVQNWRADSVVAITNSTDLIYDTLSWATPGSHSVWDVRGSTTGTGAWQDGPQNAVTLESGSWIVLVTARGITQTSASTDKFGIQIVVPGATGGMEDIGASYYADGRGSFQPIRQAYALVNVPEGTTCPVNIKAASTSGYSCTYATYVFAHKVS